jgi:hypothetical protein
MEGLDETLEIVQRQLRDKQLDTGEKHEACVWALKWISDQWAIKPPRYPHSVKQAQRLLMAMRDCLAQ